MAWMAAARRSSILVMGFKKPGVSRLTLGFDGQTPVLAACWQLIFYIVPRGLKQVKVLYRMPTFRNGVGISIA